jgi:hypothetical protein
MGNKVATFTDEQLENYQVFNYYNLISKIFNKSIGILTILIGI